MVEIESDMQLVGQIEGLEDGHVPAGLGGAFDCDQSVEEILCPLQLEREHPLIWRGRARGIVVAVGKRDPVATFGILRRAGEIDCRKDGH